MANLSLFHQRGRLLDHTPSGAVTAGSILDLGSTSGFAPVAIAASVLGAVAVEGVITGPWVGLGANAGDNVYWDANGTPYGGSADGAFTSNAAAGDWWVGTLSEDVAALAAVANIALNLANPNLPAWINKTHQSHATDQTWAAADDNGQVIHVLKDGGTDTLITLPTGVAGMEVIVVNDEVDAGNGLGVKLDGAETAEGKLTMGGGETATNTKATSVRGDYIYLVCQTAASLWRVQALRGTWVSA